MRNSGSAIGASVCRQGNGRPESNDFKDSVTLHSGALRALCAEVPSPAGRLSARLGCQQILLVTTEIAGFDSLRAFADKFGILLKLWKLDAELDLVGLERAIGSVDHVLFPANLVSARLRLPIRRCCREMNTPLTPIRNLSRTCFRNAVVAFDVPRRAAFTLGPQK